MYNKINHLMYMDGIKLFAKTEKEFETLIQIMRIDSQDIGIVFVIKKSARWVIRSGKNEITERMETAKSGKN